MDEEARKILIDRAILNAPIDYSIFMQQLGHLEYNPKLLTTTLTEIAEYEKSHKRPMLTVMAKYKDSNGRGPEFYNLSKELGYWNEGESKNVYTKKMQQEVHDYWKAQADSKKGKSNNTTVVIPNEEIEFFTQDEITLLSKWGGEVYDPKNEEHVNAKNAIKDSLGAKTQHWSNELVKRIEGYETFNWRMWSQPGWKDTPKGKVRVARFKAYTWARIYKIGDAYKDIFFTVGVDFNHKALVYKLDYFFEKESKLSESQKLLCEQLIPDEVNWLTVPFDSIPDYNWEKLLSETETFIRNNTALYDNIIKSVWSGSIDIPELKNRLIKREVPNEGHESIPERTFSFQGVDVDWQKQNLQYADTGLIGEELVIEYEKRLLKNAGKEQYVSEVVKKKDGEGYDIFSRNLDGSPKYIEVKTTEGGRDKEFPISLTEIVFSETHSDNYFLYRIFYLDKVNRVGQFHEYNGNLRQLFFLEGTHFNAFRKSKKL